MLQQVPARAQAGLPAADDHHLVVAADPAPAPQPITTCHALDDHHVLRRAARDAPRLMLDLRDLRRRGGAVKPVALAHPLAAEPQRVAAAAHELVDRVARAGRDRGLDRPRGAHAALQGAVGPAHIEGDLGHQATSTRS